MREILFRGKDADNGEWVYGYYAHFKNMHDVKADIIYTGYADMYMGSILPECYDVNPKTIGQYTGLTDKNGRKIFEGDIIHGNLGNFVVRWSDNISGFVAGEKERTHPCLNRGTMKCYKVIGNIYDNPELIEGDTNELL